jgi:hypothetical protein
MIKQIITKVGKILCIKVPKDSENFTIKAYGFAGTWLEEVQNENFNSWKTFLSKGSNQMYSILGKLSELTDEQCEEFIDVSYDPTLTIKFIYLDYCSWEQKMFDKITAKESFTSLLQLEGIDISKEDELLIIKVL